MKIPSSPSNQFASLANIGEGHWQQSFERMRWATVFILSTKIASALNSEDIIGIVLVATIQDNRLVILYLLFLKKAGTRHKNFQEEIFSRTKE